LKSGPREINAQNIRKTLKPKPVAHRDVGPIK